MRLLLDTHALLWWLAGDESLSPEARTAIADEATAVHVSAASAWEITTKHRLGKLPGAQAIVHDLDSVIARQSFDALSISLKHGQAAGALPGPHRDPFDRMLIAQAMLEDLFLVSNEHAFDVYGVTRLRQPAIAHFWSIRSRIRLLRAVVLNGLVMTSMPRSRCPLRITAFSA